jgi:biotin carboxylase
MYCAIVDGYSTGGFLARALRRHGFECVHVQQGHEAPGFYRDSFRSAEYAATIVCDGDSAQVVAEVSKYDPAFVLPGHESGVELADLLADRLALPANGMERSRARRDKHLMADALRQAGVAAPEGIVTASIEELAAWADARGHWPVVVKPVASAGTDNVIFCSDETAVRTAYRQIIGSVDILGRPNQTVLGQEFLDGTEYFVNTVSRDGQHHVAEIWRYAKRLVPGGGFIYDWEEPLPYLGEVQTLLREYVQQVLDALDIRYGPAHSEIMLTSRGPVLVETGARLAGSIIPSVVSRVFGTNHVELTAEAYAAPSAFDRRLGRVYELRSHLRYVSLISPIAGKVRSLAGFNEIRDLPSFADMNLQLALDEPLSRTVDSRTSPGYVYLVHDDPDQLRADYRTIRELEATRLYDVG